VLLAALRDDTYNIFLLLHIVSIVVAFAPAVIHPIMGAQYGAEGEPGRRFAELAHRNGQRVYLPALLAVGATGVIMVLLSDDSWSFGDTWVSLALLVWLGIGGIVSALIMPATKKVADGDPTAMKQVMLGGQISTLLVLVILYLMIFKPGA
jgi:uncharacterized membrane protein